MRLSRLFATILVLAAPAVRAVEGKVPTGRLVDPTGKLATVPIAVPGDVHTALLDAGVIPDPFFGTNECLTTWVGNHDWRIEWDFDVDAATAAKKRVTLRLEDVDTLCDLSLNGKSIGSTWNRFRRWDFDVTGKVKPGRNTLTGFFRNVIAAKEAEAKKYDHGYWVHGPVMRNLNLIRKPFCHGGWDWGLELMNVGFMKKPEILATDGITVDYVHCDQAFNADLSHATVDVHVEYVRADGGRGTKTVRREIERPRLWWPRGMGEQAFTEVSVDVEGERVTKRIALRKLELVTEPDADGVSMFFRVNGRRFFAKGADFIPCDAFESRQTPARYENLLQSVVDANMNMVRVWGGGQYERDLFYDWCDEHGLLVWQDCMFACACYPGTKGFLNEIDAEIRHQIRRLKDHPSIAIWCGDNECAMGHAGWFGNFIKTPEERRALADEYRARQKVLAAAFAELDPSRRYWPSSPYNGEGKDPVTGGISTKAGDDHNWMVWHGDRDFECYRETTPRFCSEFGYQSLSSPSVARTFCGPGPVDPSGPLFLHHQKDWKGNRRIREMVGRYFEVPSAPEDFLWISQVQQGLAIKTAIECWRSSQPHCMGTLIWQLNDVWPVASWSGVEYGGKWKVMQHLARKFYAPVAVVAVPDGDALEIRGISDVGERTGTLTVTTYDFAGRVVGETRQTASIPEGSSVLLRRPLAAWGDAETRKDRFLAFEFAFDGGAYRNDWLFARPKDCRMRRARVRKEDGALVTDVPAFFVVTDGGTPAEGNCFTLLPGKPVRTTAPLAYWYNK